MVFRDREGNIIKVYPYGSEEQQSFEQGIKLLYQLYLIDQEQQLNAKLEKEKKLESQIDENDEKVFQRCIKRSDKKYNLTQAAGILGVHRQTLYYWIKKGWLNPKRDYRNYPVFTVLDIEHLMQWRNTVKLQIKTA